jgi:LysM repeat protein
MTGRRPVVGSVPALLACAALVVGCSSGASKRTTRHVSTTTRATTTAPVTTTTAPLADYKVKPGDRLTTIASRFHVSVAAIVFVNHLADPDRLTEGQSLKIPTAPPLTLLITPSKGLQGQTFKFDLIGSKPSEVVTFEIDAPSGKHTGPPHIASKDGSVTTRYQTSAVNPPGTYTVTANGNKGTKTRATFVIAKRS